ncbi:MAG: amidohydrolase family protein [Candidatus Rokubacteria bacterium]|nr:amidohydrolase family protein [Candidatus Rokubacteria bacterium]
MPMHAELVLKRATVLTVDDRDRVAQAVAVRAGRIVAVGTDAEVDTVVGPSTRVLSLPGKTVVPGFIDSHTHSVHVGEFRFSLQQLNLPAELVPSIPEVLELVRTRAAAARPGAWIGGRNYDPNGMRERRWPTRWELDAVAPDHPVMITIRGGHACVANSRALAAAGISRDTPDPEGGVIDRDANGEPNGVLRDVMSIRAAIPPSTVEELKDGLAGISDLYVRLGVTSVHDAGATPRPESYRAFREAVEEGRFKPRAYLLVYHDFALANDLGLRTGFGDDRLRLGGVKLFADGSIQCFTCAFREPYVTRETKGWEGLRYAQGALNEAVTEAHRLGYQVAIHAQGDYGITVAVNALEHAMRAFPRPDPRHRIEHTLCPTVEDLKRMHALGIVPNFFLFHPWFWGDQHIREFIGRERAERMVPARTAIDLGMHPCAHSDCPVCTPDDPVWPSNPLWGMACAVTRRTRTGVDIGAAERITAAEALRVYTINGARASFEERIKGSIEVGKLADLVVLGANPLTSDPWAIKDIPVEKTIIGGEIVYDRDLARSATRKETTG